MTWLGSQNNPPAQPAQPSHNTTPATPQAAATPAPRAPEPMPQTSRGASIGKSIHIKGELTGSEDLSIEGKVEGKITLSGCRVTIGTTGQVTAEIVAKSVVIGGQIKGSVKAEERIEVMATGNVTGDLRAPRVVLSDGSKFKGSIDMDGSSSSSKGMRDPLLTPDEVRTA